MFARQWQDKLCQAINQRVMVQLKYDDDLSYRTFAPTAVYHSTKGNLCVSGVQLQNSADQMDRGVPHNFDLRKIRDLRLTDRAFTPDARFDRFDSKYKNGIVCSI